jgi:pyridoxamine 5'-phosphate oxidase
MEKSMTTDPHPWATELITLRAHIWTRLTRGVNDRHAPARHPTLATVSTSGVPQARTVVLRAADPEAGTLTLYTDRHSAKVAELRANPLAALHVWDAAAHLQIRIEAEVTIDTQTEPEADIASLWARIPGPSRYAYSSTATPGRPIPEALAYTKTPDPAAFARLRLTVRAIDALHLGRDHHRRARFERTDGWAGQWLVP